SASTEERAFELEEAIKSIREASSNPGISVLVGGYGFSKHPEISDSIGADGVADGADEALIKARRMADKK
ncbi:MAG: coenzyme B12-binding protein, partial [Anderseniella sp.]